MARRVGSARAIKVWSRADWVVMAVMSSVLDVLFALRELLSGTGKVNGPDLFPARSLTRWQERNLQIFEVAVSLAGEADATA